MGLKRKRRNVRLRRISSDKRISSRAAPITMNANNFTRVECNITSKIYTIYIVYPTLPNIFMYLYLHIYIPFYFELFIYVIIWRIRLYVMLLTFVLPPNGRNVYFDWVKSRVRSSGTRRDNFSSYLWRESTVNCYKSPFIEFGDYTNGLQLWEEKTENYPLQKTFKKAMRPLWNLI